MTLLDIIDYINNEISKEDHLDHYFEIIQQLMGEDLEEA